MHFICCLWLQIQVTVFCLSSLWQMPVCSAVQPACSPQRSLCGILQACSCLQLFDVSVDSQGKKYISCNLVTQVDSVSTVQFISQNLCKKGNWLKFKLGKWKQCFLQFKRNSLKVVLVLLTEGVQWTWLFACVVFSLIFPLTISIFTFASWEQLENIAGRAQLSQLINKLWSFHVFLMFPEKNRFIITVLKALNLFSVLMVRMVQEPSLSCSGQPSLWRLALLLLLLVSVLQGPELVTGLLISGLLFGKFVFPGDGPKPEARRLSGLMSGFISFRISWVELAVYPGQGVTSEDLWDQLWKCFLVSKLFIRVFGSDGSKYWSNWKVIAHFSLYSQTSRIPPVGCKTKQTLINKCKKCGGFLIAWLKQIHPKSL